MAEPQTQAPTPQNGTSRRLQRGENSARVGQLQQILNRYRPAGSSPLPINNFYDTATEQAANDFCDTFLEELLDKEKSEFEQEKYIAAMTVLSMVRDETPEQALAEDYGTPVAVPPQVTEQIDAAERAGITVDTRARTRIAQSRAAVQTESREGRVQSGDGGEVLAARIASGMIGEREESGNRGAIVRMVCNGREGLPWCGGFVNYVYDQVDPRLFNQGDYLSARSFEREGAKYGSFRTLSNDSGSGYTPRVGDVIVFGRNGGGHVGIVTGIDDNGNVTYVAGNDGNKVSARSFNISHPPRQLLGFVDVHDLAQKKGVNLQVQPDQARSGDIASLPNLAAVRGQGGYQPSTCG